MGIDYGRGQIGIALSGPAGMMGFPHAVVPNTPNALDALRALATKEQVEQIVLGVPKGSGSAEGLVEEIYAFGNALYEKTGLPVEYEDESFTTAEVLRDQNSGPRGERKDAQAAALILSRYLEKHADHRGVQEE